MSNLAPNSSPLLPSDSTPISQAHASSTLSDGNSVQAPQQASIAGDVGAMSGAETQESGNETREETEAEKRRESQNDEESEGSETAVDEGHLEGETEGETIVEEDMDDEEGMEEGSSDDESDDSYESLDEQSLEELREIWNKFDADQREPFEDFVASERCWSIENVRRLFKEAEDDQRVMVEDEEFRKDRKRLQSWIGVENGLGRLVEEQLEGARAKLAQDLQRDPQLKWKRFSDEGLHRFIFQTPDRNEGIFYSLVNDVRSCEDCFLMVCLPEVDVTFMKELISEGILGRSKKIDVVFGTDVRLDLHAVYGIKTAVDMFNKRGVGFFPFYLGNLDFLPIDYTTWYMVMDRTTGLTTVVIASGPGDRDEDSPGKGFRSYDMGMKCVYDARSQSSQLYALLEGMSEKYNKHYEAGELFMPTPALYEHQKDQNYDRSYYKSNYTLLLLQRMAEERALLLRNVPRDNLYKYFQRRSNRARRDRYETREEKEKEEKE